MWDVVPILQVSHGGWWLEITDGCNLNCLTDRFRMVMISCVVEDFVFLNRMKPSYIQR